MGRGEGKEWAVEEEEEQKGRTQGTRMGLVRRGGREDAAVYTGD